MELFHHDGHLTDAGLQALLDETLDELGRLEAAEHLSFCDVCLERYTNLLTGDTLLTPPTPLKEPVQRRLRRKAVTVMFSRYATVAAAAALAVTLWNLTPNSFTPTEQPAMPAQSQSQPFGSRMQEIMASVTGTINNYFVNATTPSRATNEERQAEGQQEQSKGGSRPGSKPGEDTSTPAEQ